MEALLGRHVDLGAVRKIGEGTFGEAFRAGDVVLKIVPMEGDTPVNGEPQKRAAEILAEAAVALTLSQLHPDLGESLIAPSLKSCESDEDLTMHSYSMECGRCGHLAPGFSDPVVFKMEMESTVIKLVTCSNWHFVFLAFLSGLNLHSDSVTRDLALCMAGSTHRLHRSWELLARSTR